jgi:uncharacterized membrane protein YhhN
MWAIVYTEVALPLVAGLCLGMMVRSLQNGARLWPLWAILSVLSVGMFVYLWRLTP